MPSLIRFGRIVSRIDCLVWSRSFSALSKTVDSNIKKSRYQYEIGIIGFASGGFRYHEFFSLSYGDTNVTDERQMVCRNLLPNRWRIMAKGYVYDKSDKCYVDGSGILSGAWQ